MTTFARQFGINRGGKDEWYTPIEAVEPILPYLKPHSKILCPFDTEQSEFVKQLRKQGHQVECSHIKNGKDFFNLEKPEVDYVISNPPFSKRDAILKRLYEWDIPFAMIFNVNGLFDSRNRSILADRGGVRGALYVPACEVY